MTEVSYVPGKWTAVAFSRYWLLIDAAPDSPQVREIWQRIDQARGFESVLTTLLRFGFEHVPDFVLLTVEGNQHILICRGRGSATLTGPGEVPSRRVDGTGLATWREDTIPADVEQVTLGNAMARADGADEADGAGPVLPAFAGVFLADSVTVALTAGPPAPPEPPALPEPPAVTRPDTMPVRQPPSAPAQPGPASPASPASP